MYNIQIKVSTDVNIQAVAGQIARLIEQATGKRCRVSVLNKRINKQKEQAELEAVVEKLKNDNSI